MKTKCVESSYDRETGISKVMIANRYGNYWGSCKLAEEDKRFESSFAGCYYAEMKANIAFYKDRVHVLNGQIKVMKEYYKMISDMRDFNPKDKFASKARRKIWELEEQKKDAIARKEAIEKVYEGLSYQRESILTKRGWVKDVN